MSEAARWGGDALAVLGTAAMTLAVSGVVRIPDTFAKIHSSAKAVVIGAVLVLAGSALTGSVEVVARAALVAFFLLLTSPVGAHALARLITILREAREHEAP